MKVALVHDYLNQRGGAERVVLALHRIFPEAPVFTSLYDPETTFTEFKSVNVIPSFAQHLPGIGRRFRSYLPVYPLAFGSFDFSGFDVVLSSSSGWAHGIRSSKHMAHICYCHTPPRWLYDSRRYMERDEYGFATRCALRGILPILRAVDQRAARYPDVYIANSNTVQERIERIYGRTAEVVYPPVEVERYNWGAAAEDYFLVVSRLCGYKRIDLVVELFNRLGLPLHIVGDGPLRASLERQARSNIQFCGAISDRAVEQELAHCRALIFPGEEDFGIVPLEANASGRPVIAFRAGGAKETVIDGVTGVFFDQPNPQDLEGAVRRILTMHFDPELLRRHAERYRVELFQESIRQIVLRTYSRRRLAQSQEIASTSFETCR